MSTATKNALPRETRINFPIGGSHWKCKPRTTPFTDLEWLSWKLDRQAVRLELVFPESLHEEASIIAKNVGNQYNDVPQGP